VRISEASILDGERGETTELLHMIGDLERIGDHASNLAESAEEMNDKQITFSDEAITELSVLMSAVKEIIALSVKAIADNDLSAAERVEPLEQVIDAIRDDVKKRHIIRLQSSKCTMEHGFILSDILINLERVADHCSNIAGCIMEMSKHNSLELHKYLDEYKHGDDHFEDLFREYSEKYCLN